MNTHLSLFWFRQDLRISDNPGLAAAVSQGSVLPVYILEAGDNPMGGASQVWLHHSLIALNHALENKLNIYCGDAKTILLKLIEKYAIQGVYWNRCYEPWRINQDALIKAQLKQMQIDCKSFNGSLLWEPWQVVKNDQSYYKVYKPFYLQCMQKDPPRALVPAPKKMQLKKDNDALQLNALNLLPQIPWHHGIESSWQMGEQAAHKKLKHFLHQPLLGYAQGRDYPAKNQTSRLSPHLHFGELSPHQVWHALAQMHDFRSESDRECFKRELIWREFSYYLLYHFPQLPKNNFQQKFNQYRWRTNQRLLTAWQQGKTGYPIIDAGMRELWQTGYMHNRVRMIVASFLIKNLGIHWHQGAQWFWDCLLDADLANNSASWQWVAGSGVDAAPFFRIFNPSVQAKKFDPTGEYIHQFVPELSQLPPPHLFKPWEAPLAILKNANITLSKTYPKPIISFETSRQLALAEYKNINKKI